MDNSVYISLSRQIGLFQDLEFTSNNIANVNTPAYNAQKLLFSQYLQKTSDNRRDAYANTPTSYRDTTSGSIKTTGNTFDFAISGTGYFQIQTPLGSRYTRAGNFQVNDQGVLVNQDGYAVLGGDNSQILIPSNARNIEVNGAGLIRIDGVDGGQVGVFEFVNPQLMRRQGNNLYSATEPATLTNTSRVLQGSLESSNVSAISETVRLLQLSRSVTNSAKLTDTVYELERKASDVFTRPQNS
ncbi:MAG: flagellar hook basal-body protein [Rickettsiales bacterium]